MVEPQASPSKKRKIGVLYGSQTGNAQSIAETVHEDALRRGYDATVIPMNKYASLLPKLEDGAVVVIVCSTTGNGDPPENCASFYRWIRRRTHPANMLKKLRFALLGLGDTNYDKYCHCAKTIHKRLTELGAESYYPVQYADEGTGSLEDVVEPWVKNLWPALEAVWSDGNSTPTTSEAATSEDGGSVSLSPTTAAKDLAEAAATPPPPPYTLPAGLKPIDAFITPGSPQEDWDEVSGEADIPRLRSNLSVEVTFAPDLDGSSRAGNGGFRRPRSSSLAEGYYSSDAPFLAKAQSARYLTACKTPPGRRVLHLTLDLDASGIKYEPGDAVGFRCPNRTEDVDFVIGKLVAAGALPTGATSDTSFTHGGASFPSPTTLREALTVHLDLNTPLRKPAIRALAQHCGDAREKRHMLLLTARAVGTSVYDAFVGAQGVTVAELLALFPSCRPPISQLLGILPPLPPRYYSVASSQLAHPSSLAVAFSIHEFETAGIMRYGLCTTWLERVVQPLLSGSTPQDKELDRIPIFIRPTKEFYLPASTKWPCVLVGAGTGVSPFMGFLEHRAAEAAAAAAAAQSAAAGCWRGGFDVEELDDEPAGQVAQWRHQEGKGDMWLFYGCRHSQGQECDWIFKEEMKAYTAGVPPLAPLLSHLITAFSRDGPSKVYVQDKLEQEGAAIAKLLLVDGGYLYVCGDAKDMAQGVHDCLCRILIKYGEELVSRSIGQPEAQAVLKDLKDRRRYVLDVWS